jgi:ribosomal protein S27AE
MDIVVAIIGLAMLIAVAAFVAQPLVVRSRTLPSSESPRDKLLAERDALYVSLRDLDFDFQTGKLLETDYRAAREQYVARGVEILKQLDAAETRPQTADRRSQMASDQAEVAIQARRKIEAQSLEDEIEAAVRARRQSTIQNPECPNCGRPVDLTDRFCGKCGAALTGEATR